MHCSRALNTSPLLSHHHHPSLELVSSSQTQALKLCPLQTLTRHPGQAPPFSPPLPVVPTLPVSVDLSPPGCCLGGVTQDLSCVWLISLDMMSCWVIHAVAWVGVLCLFMAEHRFSVWMGRIWLARSLLSGSAGCVYPLAGVMGGVRGWVP